MKMSHAASATLAAFAVIALSACSSGAAGGGGSSSDSGGSSESGGLQKISIVDLNIMSDATLKIAEEQGFFKEEGLDPQIKTVANPPAALAAVQGGQADIGFSTSTVFINARSQKIPVQVVAGAAGFPTAEQAKGANIEEFDDTGVFIDPKKGISSLKDLDGKTVALGGARNGQLEIATSYALSEAGVDPKKVNWISLDLTSALESLKSGKADAAVLVRPFTLQAEDAGMKQLIAPQPAYFGEGAINYWVTSQQTAKSQEKKIAAFQRAITKANEYANEHMDDALTIGLKMSKLEIPLDRAGKLYWPTEVRESDLQRVKDRMEKLGYLKAPADLTDAVLPAAK